MNEGTYTSETSQGLTPDPTATYGEDPGTANPARKVVLAGIGAAAVACDVAGDTFDRFVDRGKEAEADVFRRVDDARLTSTVRRTRFGDAVRSAMNAFLDGVNVPNKADIDIINTKLNIVSRKLDDLQMDAVGATSPSVTPTPPVATVPVETVIPNIGSDEPAAD